MAKEFSVVLSGQYLDDKERFRNNSRVLKELTKLEKRLSREGTGWIKEIHRVGDLWTVYVGAGRRLLIQKSGDVIHLVRFDEHDDAYLAAGRSAFVTRTPPPSLPEVTKADGSGEERPLLADHSDDFLTRLGVPHRDLALVRGLRFLSDVYECSDVLGDDLCQRLLDLHCHPPAQVLADYELRGRDDASEALLRAIEDEAAGAREEANRAHEALVAKEAELNRTHAELATMRQQGQSGADVLAALESKLETLSEQVPALLEVAHGTIERAADAEKRAAKAEKRAAKAARRARKNVAGAAGASAAGAEQQRPAELPRQRWAVARPDDVDDGSTAASRAHAAVDPRRAPTVGTPWTGSPGQTKWRLSPSTRALTRVRDGASLDQLIGKPAARALVTQFLAVRPSGGRVWVDDDAHAVTLVDGRLIYLGQLGVADDAAPEGDGSLEEAVRSVLREAPSSSAREIAFHLTRHGHPGVTRTDVNSVLYRARTQFAKDDSVVPRWRLVAGSEGRPGGHGPMPGAHPGGPGPRRRRPSLDTYSGLVSQLDAQSSAPVANPLARAASRTKPRQVLELMAWQREAMSTWYSTGCRGIVEAVTGTGKTHVGLEAVAHAAAQGERSTVLVPSVDLQDQWVARFERFLPALRVARVGGKASGHPATAEVTIAVVNSALNKDLSALSADSLLVADEVHRYGSEQFQIALRAGYGRRLGLTATLERSDEAIETVLAPYFGGSILTVGFDRALREGVVAPFRLVMAPVELSEDEQAEYDALSQRLSNALKFLRSQGALSAGNGPSVIQQLGRLGGAGGRIGSSARSAQSAMRDRRKLLADLEAKLDAIEELSEVIDGSQGAVLFTQSKEVAEAAAGRLREWGVTAAALHSEMGTPERRANLAGLERGDIRALAAPKLLDEGIDLPSVDLGVVMTASRSRRQMVQRLGRVIRRKPDGRPVDFVILFALGTVEDPDSGVHEGFFDLVGDIADNKLVLPLGWTAADLVTREPIAV